MLSKCCDSLATLHCDGRICFTEFQAFCKKAQRTIRRRGIATITGTGKASPVPPQYLKDRQLERLFAGYCYLGAARPAAGGKAMLDERRFLRLLKEAKLLGKPKMHMQAAQLCFAQSRAKNERRLDFRTFLASLGSVASHMGVSFDDVAAAVKTVPAPGKGGGGGSGASGVERVASFMAPIGNKTPGRPASAQSDSGGGGGGVVFGSDINGGAFSPKRASSARPAKHGTSGSPTSLSKASKPSPLALKTTPVAEDEQPPAFEANFDEDPAPAFEANFGDAEAPASEANTGEAEAEVVAAAPEALAAFDRRDAEKPGGADGSLSLDALRLAISDVVGLNGASAGAVGEALENTFSDIDTDFTGILPRRFLGLLLRNFHAEVDKAAKEGRALLPPTAVPSMSKPQADAITGVFTSTCKPGSSGMTRGEFLELISASGLCGDAHNQTAEVAVEVTFCRCVSVGWCESTHVIRPITTRVVKAPPSFKP